MRLFLDTSALLAGCGSTRGASRVIIDRAKTQGWVLMASPYVLAEMNKNISKIGTEAKQEWLNIQARLLIVPDVVSVGRIVVFGPSKDRPVLLTAFARAQVLITHDSGDFSKLGGYFYGLEILTPGEFPAHERKLGRFNPKEI